MCTFCCFSHVKFRISLRYDEFEMKFLPSNYLKMCGLAKKRSFVFITFDLWCYVDRLGWGALDDKQL